ncbi:hypothetical protein BATDEDRAFT_91789 [Batrachochytrium dendrobatidis JAM81]|uniref:FAD-binding FR-type domain-containing protein n=2 Tax=Batrachochytrium dendrobatidis TaxID=109871 RepID=F4PBB7_BATDJ|nr:uncharacterized protein BATDEDRAFT_91789 [Batrachochytrium dendrobatidis JAM81]EGF77415.1 hypothetical protein BATDEDRAFT_91789 [Batrachochytrium dendrobatidis JAM81]OAJ37888.1 hypothetical protein BDEG_21860 [Batrachochytrium dendrobatidis JEL423]|eukprot:XP_006682068.1 hypothetical protein BATDEDRAFT_91789 [Batrachochytrium dendrobatidis JAM81]
MSHTEPALSLPSKSCANSFGLQLISTVSAIVAFGFILVLPSYLRVTNQSYHIVFGSVSSIDQYFLIYYVAPLGILTTAMYIRCWNNDADVANALCCSKPNQVPSRFWIPRWKIMSRLSNAFSACSSGDILLGSMVVLSNVLWLIVPIIIKVLMYPNGKLLSTRGFLNHISNTAAMTGVWDGGLAIVFAVRENLAAKALLGNDAGQYHRGIKYHIVLGYASFGFIIYHAIHFLVLYTVEGNLAYKILPWLSNKAYTNSMGIISCLSLILMIISSIFKARRSSYRIFYWTHQLYIAFLLFAIVHAYQSIYPLIAPLLYFIYDRILPRLKTSRNTTAIITKVSSDIVRVDIPILAEFKQTSTYAPGDWINLLIPSISSVNWHPFSIASYHATSPDTMTFFIKNYGPWTASVYNASSVYGTSVAVKVDGVFGSRSKEYLGYKHLVLVGGGTGIAALIPYMQHYLKATDGKITLVWTARNASDICAYRNMLELLSPSSTLMDRVTVHMHLTRCIPTAEVPIDDDEKLERTCIDLFTEKELDAKSVVENESSIFMHSHRVSTSALSYGTIPQDKKPCQTMFGIYAAILAVVMFSCGITGYILGRTLIPGYETQSCRLVPQNTLSFMDNFMCWYYYYWAPIVYACALATVGGLVSTTAMNFYRGRGSFQRYITQDESATKPLIESNTTHPLNAETLQQWFSPVQERPELDTILKGVFSRCSDKDTDKVAVMAAGPEHMVREVERVTVEGGQCFYRESWQI